MKVICLEEHFVTNALLEAWSRLPNDIQEIGAKSAEKPPLKSLLENFAELRIRGNGRGRS